MYVCDIAGLFVALIFSAKVNIRIHLVYAPFGFVSRRFAETVSLLVGKPVASSKTVMSYLANTGNPHPHIDFLTKHLSFACYVVPLTPSSFYIKSYFLDESDRISTSPATAYKMGLGSHGLDPKALLKAHQTQTIRLLSITASTFSIVGCLVTIYWFILMKRNFRRV